MRERLGVGERDHVAGALDQRVMRVGHVATDDLADRVIDRRRPRSLDDVHGWVQAGQRLDVEPLVVEENVP